MLKGSTTLIVLVGVLLAGLVSAKEQEVFLPADCDVLKIVGNGFKLELKQFETIKNEFKEVQKESFQVEEPRDGKGESGANGNGADNGQNVGTDEKAITNENLFDETKKEKNDLKDYGILEDDLLLWISNRASSLINRIERYNDELAGTSDGNRIVLDILLLNTLVDLDNLKKEKVFSLRWVDGKLNKLLTQNIHRELRQGEVKDFVVALIEKNKKIEDGVTGKNKPGKVWVTNTQAIKRVLHEQRFSELLGKIIVEYLAGKFSMMKRSVVYEINRQPKQLDDGLYYANAQGRVPADFPFSAQDAISHGDFN